jgi:hypothetical protein
VSSLFRRANPQGCEVSSFKEPSAEELDHDFIWRMARRLPARGHIGIFNRSHYEELLVVRVHPELLHAEKLPPRVMGKDIWKISTSRIPGSARRSGGSLRGFGGRSRGRKSPSFSRREEGLAQTFL